LKRYKVIFNPEALVEYVDAVDWYKQRSVNASENFIIDVEDAISQIQEIPTGIKK
jgi:plasmid stabilization system protein ParE